MSAGAGRPEGRRARLLELRRRFVSGASEDAREMRRLIGQGAAQGPGAPPADAARLRKLAHDLRGSGGAYGFPAVSEAGATIEDAVAAGHGPEAVAAGLDALEAAIAAAAEAGGAQILEAP